jgi:ribulose-phosphate 3-epimerase
MIKIAPSILACDFSRLEEEIRDVERGGADLLHLDVMDGHFVPNITFGPVIIKGIRKLTSLPLDTHLMISDPEKYTPRFIESGCDAITFHKEVSQNPEELIEKIKSAGCKAGLSLNPETPVEDLNEYLSSVDIILVMSVHPGFGGQHFISSAFEKVKYLKKKRTEKKLSFEIAVDGGVNIENAQDLIESGADILIAGTTIFGSPDRKKVLSQLRCMQEEICSSEETEIS